jgi:hypothetical protein
VCAAAVLVQESGLHVLGRQVGANLGGLRHF